MKLRGSFLGMIGWVINNHESGIVSFSLGRRIRVGNSNGSFVQGRDVGDTEGGPKGDILGQAGAGIGTDPCVDFPG